MRQHELRIHKNFPNYGITCTGRVWSYKRQTWKKSQANANGYLKTQLRTTKHTSGYRNMFIHRLVMELFGEDNTQAKRCINHKDGDKLNNHYNNLEWTTHKENNIHRDATGLTKQYGYTHSNSVVTPELVSSIKADARSGMTQRNIAAKYSIGNGTVNRVINDNGELYK